MLNVSKTLLALGLVGSVGVPAWAGDFVTLPTSGNLRVEDYELFQIDSGPLVGPNTYAFPSFLTLVDERASSFGINGEVLGNFFDYVFSDAAGSLYFGSRLVLAEPDGDDYFEINDLFRTGYATVGDVAVGWSYVTDYDLYIYAAGRTSAGFGENDALDLDSVGFRSDINYEEGNPQTALYLIKTQATGYQWLDNAVRLRQGGEEGDAGVINISFAGFAPVTAPVPEPSTYAMLLGGLALTAWAARRGSKA